MCMGPFRYPEKPEAPLFAFVLPVCHRYNSLSLATQLTLIAPTTESERNYFTFRIENISNQFHPPPYRYILVNFETAVAAMHNAIKIRNGMSRIGGGGDGVVIRFGP